jgi:hypothetical protein
MKRTNTQAHARHLAASGGYSFGWSVHNSGDASGAYFVGTPDELRAVGVLAAVIETPPSERRPADDDDDGRQRRAAGLPYRAASGAACCPCGTITAPSPAKLAPLPRLQRCGRCGSRDYRGHTITWAPKPVPPRLGCDYAYGPTGAAGDEPGHGVAASWDDARAAIDERLESTPDGERALLRDALRAEHDSGDAFASVYAAFFALAAELDYREPASVPSSWRYSPGALRGWRDIHGDADGYRSDFAAACETTSDGELVAFGAVLERWIELLRAAGRAY